MQPENPDLRLRRRVTLVLGWCSLEWEKGLGEEMVFSFLEYLCIPAGKEEPGGCLLASHPGSGQLLPALALLLPEMLLNSILGLQYSLPLLTMVAKSPAC